MIKVTVTMVPGLTKMLKLLYNQQKGGTTDLKFTTDQEKYYLLVTDDFVVHI